MRSQRLSWATRDARTGEEVAERLMWDEFTEEEVYLIEHWGRGMKLCGRWVRN